MTTDPTSNGDGICEGAMMKILHQGALSKNLRHLASLAEHFGIEVEYVEVTGLDLLLSAVVGHRCDGVVLDIASLQHQYGPDQLKSLIEELASYNLAVLLFATETGEGANNFVNVLTIGAIQRLELKKDVGHVSFPVSAARFTTELSSYSFRRLQSDVLRLALAAWQETDILMELDEAPSFVRVKVGRASVFVWSTFRVFDIHARLAAEKEFEDALDQYIPAILFLRFAFRDRCWHNPTLGAGIVIDDPLLSRRYGFINFSQLLGSARKHGYHVTLAFIPWNHWRTRAKHAGLFLNYADCFGICAHGCDHTNREFRSTNYDQLVRANVIAFQRMEQHRQRTGLVSEPLMVCPQERYSLEAIQAFADSRQFLGLVTTACMPRNLASSQITAAELLRPAQDSFFGFPIFKRHYSGDMSVFALSLFLGKPAILVEHHQFFKGGPGGAEAFASELLKLNPHIRWRPLAETVMRTHLRRRVADGRYEVRFFTDTFKLVHEAGEPAEYRIMRRIPESTPVRGVTVNGVDTPFSREAGMLLFECQADQRRTLRIQVDVPPVKPVTICSSGIKHNALVALRRGLAELRDNVMARNGTLLQATNAIVKSVNKRAPVDPD